MKLISLDNDNIVKIESILLDEKGTNEYYVHIVTPQLSNTLSRVIEERSITKEYFSYIVFKTCFKTLGNFHILVNINFCF